MVTVTTEGTGRVGAGTPPSFRVLGSLVAHVGDTLLDIGGPKERTVLASLLAADNRAVSVDALVEAVWRERPPRSAARTIQSYVARLRRSFATASDDAVVVTEGHGYALHVPRSSVDALRFEDAAQRGAALLDRNDAVAALASFDAALADWRGEPYAGFEDVERCASAARHLAELHEVVVESRFDALLALGAAHEIVPALTAATEAAPLRERRWGQLIIALYRGDRQADALRAYRRARAVLVDELGVEPSQALRELEAAVLAQDDHVLRAGRRHEPVLSLPAALSLDDSLMIGRQVELDRLSELWASARRGTKGLVSIVGVEGVGKTRLAAELAMAVHAEGSIVAFARCDADHRTARSLLDQALRSAGGSLLRAQSDAVPGESLGASVARRLSSWANLHPVLVVLDDLHEAEAEVLGVVAETSATTDGCVLIVVVFRTDSAEGSRAGPGEMQVVLREVDDHSARRICELYGDAWSADDVDRIRRDAGGVPLLIHEKAMAEAHAGATRRLEEAAGEAHTAGFRLSTSRQAVAEEVVELRRVADQQRRQLASRSAVPLRAEPPFRGLMPFQVEDAEWFFGRERMVAEVVARLMSEPALLVVGASGSGKSSLVRAGVVPALADGVPARRGACHPVLLTPGVQPIVALDTALAGVRAGTPTARVVVVVDQLEELFSLCPSPADREAFARSLSELVDGGARLIGVVRADQIEGVAQVSTLATLFGGRDVLVGPLTEIELQAAIVRPAELAGLSFEDGLVDEILDDARGAPGALPFVQTALLETWNRRDESTLTLDGYRRSGGVRGAIARMAEEMYATLTSPQQEAARRMLVRLADAGGDGVLDLRRRITVTELARADDTDAWVAFDRMVKQRLLTVSGDTAEVTHETLFREWPRLRDWLAADVEGRALHQRLGDSARSWEASGRDPSELVRGSRLAATDEWARDHTAELNDAERDLLDASRAEQALELNEAVARADREARAGQRLRRMLAVGGVLLVLAIVAGAVALWERGRSQDAAEHAEQQAQIADAGRLAAKAIVDQRLDHAMLTAVAAVRLSDTPETRAGLLSVLQRAPFALRVARLPNGGRPQTISVSPDGSLLAVADAGFQIHLFDAETLEAVGEIPGAGHWGLSFLPDGRLAYPVEDAGTSGVQIVDPLDPTTAVRLQRNSPLAPLEVATDGRGRYLAAVSPGIFGKSQLTIWEVAAPSTPALEIELPFFAEKIAMLPDGSAAVVGGGGGMAMVDRATGDVMWSRADGRGIAVSGDGRLIAVQVIQPDSGETTEAIAVHDRSGRELRTLSTESVVTALAFDAKGEVLLVGTEEHGIEVWDPAGQLLRRLRGHANTVRGVGFSSDGRRAHSVSLDGTVITWSTMGDESAMRRLDGVTPPDVVLGDMGSSAFTPPVAFLPDGSVVHATEMEFKVRERASGRITDAGPIRPGHVIAGFGEIGIYTFTVSPDGTRIVSAGGGGDNYGGGEVVLLDRSTGARLAALSLPDGRLPESLAFSADGERLAVGLYNDRFDPLSSAANPVQPGPGEVLLLDARTLEVEQRLYVPGETERNTQVVGVAFDRGGRRIVAASCCDVNTDAEGQTHFWYYLSMIDIESGSELWRNYTPVASYAFSPDDALLAVGGGDGAVRVLDPATGEVLRSTATRHDGFADSVAFAPDGSTIVSAGTDGLVRIWRAADLAEMGTFDASRGNGPMGNAVTFTPDGSRLLMAEKFGEVWEVPVRIEDLIANACQVTSRDLTEEEWKDLLPDRPYQPVCAA